MFRRGGGGEYTDREIVRKIGEEGNKKKRRWEGGKENRSVVSGRLGSAAEWANRTHVP